MLLGNDNFFYFTFLGILNERKINMLGEICEEAEHMSRTSSCGALLKTADTEDLR